MAASVKVNAYKKELLFFRLAWAAGFGLLLILSIQRVVSGAYVQQIAGEYLVGLSLPFVTAYIDPDRYYQYLAILRIMAQIIFWLVAALIVRRQPQDRMALLVASVLLLFPVALGGGDAPLENLFTFLGLGLFVYLLYVFPNGRFIPHTGRNRLLLGLAILLTPFLAYAIFAAALPADAAGEYGYGAFLVTLAAIMFGGVFSQFYRFRFAANPTQRQQTRWILFGLGAQLIWIILWLLSFSVLFTNSGIDEAQQAFILLHVNIFIPLFLPATFAVAVLYHGLWPGDPLLNRALVYGALSAIIVLLYIIIVGLLGVIFQSSGNLLIALIATGVVALLFQPLRIRLQRAVNRLMVGERDDPAGMLTRLATQFGTAGTTDSLLANMAADIANALKLPHVSIWLPEKGGEQWTMAVYAGVEHPEVVEQITIQYQDEEIGRLAVQPRPPGKNLAKGDKQLLGSIAQLLATTIHALQLNEQLQQSRQKLVTAREEERRRIRRDLHDGLGPALASLTLQADTAKDMVRSNPAGAIELLEKITAKAQKSVLDIRHLVDDMRPPALDELGLEGAVQQIISGFSPGKLSFTLESTGNLSTLPAALEVAAYRILQEAINNVVRHAQATQCRIRLTLDDALNLEVTDNGIGFNDGTQPGIGLRSMRERAAELGGMCLIKPGLSGGTRVFARLPLRNQE